MVSTQLAPTHCFHCHEIVPSNMFLAVDFDDEPRVMCCLGCQAVMSAIVDGGLGDYYRYRTEPAIEGELPTALSEKLDSLAIYDSPEVSERYLQRVDSDDKVDAVDLIVQDLRCGACVWLLERAVRQLPGVTSATFNFSTSRGHIEFENSQVNLSTILRQMAGIGYQAVPFDIDAREQQLQQESRTYSQRLFVAGIGMMQVMMYALPVYVAGDAGLDPALEQLLRWASLVLTTPVMFYAAMPFLRGAWRDLRNLRPGMDVPVTIGLLLAFILSVHATVTAHGEIYFDSVSMFVFLLLGARYLEWRSRRRAMRTIDDVATSAPDTAQLIVVPETGVLDDRADDGSVVVHENQTVELVPAARLKPGDRIRVDAGARVPADGRVLQGRGSVDNALLTGESLPVPIAPGEFVAGGALLVGSPLTLRVEQAQSQSTLSTIQRLIERGNDEKPRAVQLADYVASVFVTALLLIALLVFIWWWNLDASRALSVTISVLIVSCPCALSLATPAAMAAATGRLLQQKILVTRGHALDRLANVTDIVFDKTGTVTVGEPVVSSIATNEFISTATALAIVQWMEEGSVHPYAKSLLECEGASSFDTVSALFPELNIDQRDRIDHVPGSGIVVALEGGRELRLGSIHWCGLSQSDRLSSSRSEISEIVLSLLDQQRKSSRLATFFMTDALRPESSQLMEVLIRRGFNLHLLSGDHGATVRHIADSLGIECYRSDAKPDEKQAYVQNLQLAGKTVMMVGDGINDAPVLAHADISLALNSASSLAQTAADVIALNPGLQAVLPLIDKAQSSRRVMRQNITWAIAYNVIAIPVAAAGWLPAWGAAIGMAMSSLLVALNALRLWRDGVELVDNANQGRVERWNRCIS